jgi:hypothetical protein
MVQKWTPGGVHMEQGLPETRVYQSESRVWPAWRGYDPISITSTGVHTISTSRPIRAAK